MQQVQKMEALGTLAGGLAHRFNNVLMAIQGNLSLIHMHQTADHPMQKHLERINQSAEKGARLAKEILGFAKIGKYVVMPTDLNKILRSTSRMFVRSNASLKIVEIYAPDLWQTRVDRVQIGQVMLSLYMNAAGSHAPAAAKSTCSRKMSTWTKTIPCPTAAKPVHMSRYQ